MIKGLVNYPSSGCIVEFLQGNAVQIAWVLESEQTKVRLLLPNRRELSLASNRLLPWSGPAYSPVQTKDEAIALVEKHHNRRQELKNSINAIELWELAEGELEQAEAGWFAELDHFEPDIDLVASHGLALLECKSYFKFNPPKFEILERELVMNRLQEQEATAQREAIVNQGSNFFQQLWLIHCNKPQTLLSLEPDLAKHLQRLILNRLADPETQAEENLWRLLIKGLPADSFIALHLAEAWGLVQPHHNFLLNRADYDPTQNWCADFAETIAQLQTYPQLPPIDLPFLSIDSPTTEDIDDAFHVQSQGDGYVLTLALACPALNWPLKSPLDKTVLHRTSSLYLPEDTYHMLPETLTMTYSLKANTPKPALLLQCEINSQGEITSAKPSLAQVCLQANLHYDAVEQILDKQDPKATVAENPAASYPDQLNLAYELAKLHQAKRINQGAVIIDRPDINITLTPDLKVTLEEEHAPAAHLLVSELMVMTNNALANFAKTNQLPLLYRTQDVAVPKEFAGIWSEPQDIARVVRVLASAILETTPRPHAGLGVPLYAPTSSPLRRYADLINEYQFVKFLQQEQPLSQDDLNALLLQLNTHIEAVSKVQRFRPRYWKLEYFKQNDGWWPAIITDENDHYVHVTLPKEQLMLRGKRNLFGERTHLGQKLEVRLGKISPLYNEIQLVETREN